MGGEKSLKVFERVPQNDIWPVFELISWALRERTWCVIRTTFGLGSRISKVALCTWEWPSLAFPFTWHHLRYTHIPFRARVPKAKTWSKSDNFLSLGERLLTPEKPRHSLQEPPHLFSLPWVAHRGHKQYYVLCMLSTVSLSVVLNPWVMTP